MLTLGPSSFFTKINNQSSREKGKYRQYNCLYRTCHAFRQLTWHFWQ